MTERVKLHLDTLLARYPALLSQKEALCSMFEILAGTYRNGGKLLVCGNGGSCADSEHIVGELMKSFMFRREIDEDVYEALTEGGFEQVAKKLEGALPAISLCNHSSLTTAYINDTDPLMTYAQQLYGFGAPGDVLMAISTSGNAQNCVNAVVVAKALGIKTVALTGRDGGKLAALCDSAIIVPEQETYKIQELHLPVYHCLCAMLEQEFFG